MWILVGLLFLCNFFVYLYIEYKQFNSLHKIKAITYIRLIYMFLYGLVPGILIITQYDGEVFGAIDYSSEGVFALFLLYFCTILGYIFLGLGYRLKFKNKFKIVGLNLFLNINKKSNELLIYLSAIIGLILGGVCLHLWSMAYGNIFGLIKVASMVRSGYSSVTNAFAFFKHPAGLVIISSIMFFVLIINSNYSKQIILKLLFLISLFLSITYLLACDGRTGMAFYLFQYVLVFMYCKRTEITVKYRTMLLIVAIAIILLLIIQNLNTVTYYIRTGNWVASTSETNLFLSILSNFEYTVVSGQFILQNRIKMNIDYTIFNDILTGIFAWIPSSLQPINMLTVWEYNTSLITNGEKSGTLPCDIITLSIYDLGILGTIIIPIFWGIVIKKIDGLLEGSNKFNKILFVLLLPSFIGGVTGCSLYNMLLNTFEVFIIGIVYFIFFIILKSR